MAKVLESRYLLAPTTELLELALNELHEERAHVLHLMAQLRRLPEGDERDELEGQLYAALVHLKHETAQALKEWNKLTDHLPER